jgi:hypothetical protein
MGTNSHHHRAIYTHDSYSNLTCHTEQIFLKYIFQNYVKYILGTHDTCSPTREKKEKIYFLGIPVMGPGVVPHPWQKLFMKKYL